MSLDGMVAVGSNSLGSPHKTSKVSPANKNHGQRRRDGVAFMDPEMSATVGRHCRGVAAA